MNEDWYKERNKRTNSFDGINDSCYGIKVKIEVTNDTSAYSTQVMLEVLTNILARWCRNISIIADDARRLNFNAGIQSLSLLENVDKELYEIDPNGHFAINKPEIFAEDLCIFVGPPITACKIPYIAIDSNGWVASCSFNSFAECKGLVDSDANPLGPAFAACLANAEVFRWANSIKTEPYSKWYDLFETNVSDHSINNIMELKPFDLGRLHLIGCGAIGSSFTYLLKLMKITGEILFVDADSSVELHNTSSSLLFKAGNCDGIQKKTEICENYLLGSNLKTSAFNDDYRRYLYDHHNMSSSADVILCFANDFNIWSTIQNLYPPVVFHATTSRSWGINIGRHIPLKDGCIMCTFQNLAKAVFVPKCAEVDLPVTQNEASESEPHASILPFLSPAAAIVALSELIKLMHGKNPNENSTQFNMGTHHGDFVEDQQKANNCDICKNQIPGMYEKLGVKLNF